MVAAADPKMIMEPYLISESGRRARPSRLFISFSDIEVEFPSTTEEPEIKEWIWNNCKDQLLSNMNITYEKVDALDVERKIQQHQLRLLDRLTAAHRQYLQMDEPTKVFGSLLASLLELTNSGYGFITEQKFDEHGTMYLKSNAYTDISWNEQTRAYVESHRDDLRFYNQKSLFGYVMVNGVPIISNDPKSDKRSCGLPPGHPELNCFLGIPFFSKGGNKMIGMVGLANKPGGYSHADIDFLEPLMATCSNFVQAYAMLEQNDVLINRLEDKVAERTKELELANKSLEEAHDEVVRASAAQLEQFASMSHEIRTPLNCIVGLSSLLRETELTPFQQDSLKMIVSSGELLVAVVNDILDYSKLHTGHVLFNIEPADLQDTLDSVVQSISFQAEEKTINLKTIYDPAVPQYFDTDNRRLQQILYNLLGNAVKFSKRGGDVELRVEVVQAAATSCPHHKDSRDVTANHNSYEARITTNRGGSPVGQYRSACPHHLVSHADRIGSSSNSDRHCDRNQADLSPRDDCALRFSVKDFGVGIDKKDFDKIFQPFLQANRQTESSHGGTGLGLAITSRLVNGLGGTINVDSELGLWTEFTVDFPISKCSIVKYTGIQDIRIILMHHDPTEYIRDDIVTAFGLDVIVARDWHDKTINDVCTAVEPNKLHLWLVEETLVDSDTYTKIASQTRCVLVTFGPERKVSSTAGHLRTLKRMLPCVLVRSFAEYAGLSHAPALKRDDSSPSTRDTPVLTNLRVLIAEDNIVNQKVLRNILHRMEIDNVDVVGDGQQAVDMCQKNKYDIVFMDMQMPVMDGLEACRIITERRKKEMAPGPKVVFVTASVSVSQESIAAEAGGDGFISKPFNLQTFQNFFHSLHW